MKKILSIIGARPQFIKHAPMQLELQKYLKSVTVHTGQHYNTNMSDIFFNELNIQKPDFLINIGVSKPNGEQTGIMLAEIEKIYTTEKPDAVLVYGDTNSTLAATLAGVKMEIPIIHIEAGLRSYNKKMPEEINRIIADQFSDILFCPTQDAVNNLAKEGIVHDKIFVCGDVMCDILHLIKPKAERPVPFEYYFATVHRPYNTDDPVRLRSILDTLNSLNEKVIFAIHPRTVARIKSFGLNPETYSNIIFTDPLGYVQSISHQTYASCIITDSGGMQKEAYMLKKKCITLRSETEWPETLAGGWNTLVFDDLSQINTIIGEKPSHYREGIYGNGYAAQQITSLIKANI